VDIQGDTGRWKFAAIPLDVQERRRARASPRASIAMHLPVSPLYLHFISPISPLYLHHISQVQEKSKSINKSFGIFNA
jgi:hypothetical protein